VTRVFALSTPVAPLVSTSSSRVANAGAWNYPERLPNDSSESGERFRQLSVISTTIYKLIAHYAWLTEQSANPSLISLSWTACRYGRRIEWAPLRRTRSTISRKRTQLTRPYAALSAAGPSTTSTGLKQHHITSSGSEWDGISDEWRWNRATSSSGAEQACFVCWWARSKDYGRGSA